MNFRIDWGALATALYAFLIIALCAWQLIRPGGPNAVIWVIQLLPLVVFLPSVLRRNPRGLIGLCFVLLLYFIRAVEGVMATNRAWIDWTLLCLSISLFVCAMLASRQSQYRSPKPSLGG